MTIIYNLSCNFYTSYLYKIFLLITKSQIKGALQDSLFVILLVYYLSKLSWIYGELFFYSCVKMKLANKGNVRYFTVGASENIWQTCPNTTLQIDKSSFLLISFTLSSNALHAFGYTLIHYVHCIKHMLLLFKA